MAIGSARCARVPVVVVVPGSTAIPCATQCVREELFQLNADFQENLRGLDVVQMFRRERVNGERFARQELHTARP